jgi:signal peptidase I
MSSFVVEVYRVSGHSMEQTLHDKNYTLVLKLPVSITKIKRSNYTPKRGDIIVAHIENGVGDYQSTVGGSSTTMIKRVIGLPGERVVVNGNTITVYNKDHSAGFNPDNGSSWQAAYSQDTRKIYVDLQLSRDEVFVVGDNRPVSNDSRINGPIRSSQIIGKVIYSR